MTCILYKKKIKALVIIFPYLLHITVTFYTFWEELGVNLHILIFLFPFLTALAQPAGQERRELRCFETRLCFVRKLSSLQLRLFFLSKTAIAHCFLAQGSSAVRSCYACTAVGQCFCRFYRSIRMSRGSTFTLKMILFIFLITFDPSFCRHYNIITSR